MVTIFWIIVTIIFIAILLRLLGVIMNHHPTHPNRREGWHEDGQKQCGQATLTTNIPTRISK